MARALHGIPRHPAAATTSTTTTYHAHHTLCTRPSPRCSCSPGSGSAAAATPAHLPPCLQGWVACLGRHKREGPLGAKGGWAAFLARQQQASTEGAGVGGKLIHSRQACTQQAQHITPPPHTHTPSSHTRQSMVSGVEAHVGACGEAAVLEAVNGRL